MRPVPQVIYPKNPSVSALPRANTSKHMWGLTPWMPTQYIASKATNLQFGRAPLQFPHDLPLSARHRQGLSGRVRDPPWEKPNYAKVCEGSRWLLPTFASAGRYDSLTKMSRPDYKAAMCSESESSVCMQTVDHLCIQEPVFAMSARRMRSFRAFVADKEHQDSKQRG